MEEATQKIQTNNDDEVLVKQVDGSFKLVKMSDLGALKPLVLQSAQKKEEPRPSPTNHLTIKQLNNSTFIPSIQLLDQTTDDLIRKSGLAVAPELRPRLKIIIISRLKDVRKIPETRERLTAAPPIGGAGLKTEEAEQLIKMIEEERSKIPNSKFQIPDKFQISNVKKEPVAPLLPASQRPPLIPPEGGEILPPPPPPPSISPKFVAPQPPVAAPFRAKPTVTSSKISNPPTGGQYPISSSDIKPVRTLSTLKIVSQAAKPKVEITRLPPLPPKPQATVAIPQTPAGRSQVADVLYKPRLVGPLEELKEMSLIDFRRLSPQPKVTTDKIYAKIELLAEQGYEKRIQGIKAWQASPVSAAYSAILNESLGKAVPVARIIEERKKAGQETLSPEEFKAVMELNKRLRY